MPIIFKFECSHCGFALPTGWGGYLYVENNNGERITCGHPSEKHDVIKVLGKDPPSDLVKQRVGYNYCCVCLDCLHKFDADFHHHYFVYVINPLGGSIRNDGLKTEKDKRECPKCKSKNIGTINEMVGKTCPKCEKGIMGKIDTGCIS